MGWTPPTHWTETEAQLKKSGTVTLNSAGKGTITFDPDSARQRWVVTGVEVTTNQAFNAGTVPTVNLALNANDLTTMSDGNRRGATWSGNQDTWTGSIDVSPADFLSVIFGPPAGQAGTSLAGVICKAVITGVKYNRRA
jgi:glucose/arabinose dehydrogenase